MPLEVEYVETVKSTGKINIRKKDYAIDVASLIKLSIAMKFL